MSANNPDNKESPEYLIYVTSISSNGKQVLIPAGKHPRMRLVRATVTTLVMDTGRMLNKEEIKNVLRGIKESIIYEMKPILNVYKDHHSIEHPLGFWTIPRLLFPEIDGLGRLRYGSTNVRGDSRCPIQFMRNYFPRAEYKEISGFIYNVYRHGLTHSHWPKKMIINNKVREWVMILSIGSQIHLEFSDKDKTRLNISAKDFYEDFLKSIDKYIKDFDNNNALQVYKLTRKFSQTYFIMHDPEKEEDIKKNKSKRKYLLDSDFDFFI